MTVRLCRKVLGVLVLGASAASCTGTLHNQDGGLQADAAAIRENPRDGAVDHPSDADPEAEGPDSGGDGDGDGDAGAPLEEEGPVVIPPGSVAVVMAVGRGGRTTLSCDEGRTWIESHTETAPTVRCWGQPDNAIPQTIDGNPNPDWLECDHSEGSTTGLVYHDGWFIRSLGWGTDGRTLRSHDGVAWSEPAPSFKATFLGLVVMGDTLAAMGTPQPFLSNDDGSTWTMTAELGWGAGHVRKASASWYGGGSLVFITDEGIWSSRDQGASFQGPAEVPCPGNINGFASSAQLSVLASGDGMMCTTSDGGQSWSQHALGRSLFTNPVWNGQVFSVWGEDDSGKASRFSSPNGTDWTAMPMAQRVDMGTVGATVSGGFVATNAVWNGGYENQRFFRSDDGVNWETLPNSAFASGHPISHFASGVVPANAYCPGTP